MKTVEFFANRVCDSLIDASPSWFDGRRAFILDGTTITLPPTPKLQEAFPPASNPHGDTVWPVAMLLVAHELQSGCALPPEIGAMYGKNHTSEARLVEEGDGYKTWRLRWTPSHKDRQSHPDLPEAAAVEVWLHEVSLDNGETLYLVTTLPVQAGQAGESYRRRHDVEDLLPLLQATPRLPTSLLPQPEWHRTASLLRHHRL